MVRAAIIAPDSDIRYQLEELVASVSGLHITRRWEKYPNRHEIARFLRATATQLVIISVEQLDTATAVIENAASIQRGLQFVAVDRTCEVSTLRKLARLGVREFLSLPATAQSLQECLMPLVELIEREASPPSVGSLFTFLPAKGGSGASTTALNVSHAMCAGVAHRVLLADFDLNNGILDLMVNLKHEHTISDALDRLDDIDQVWSEIVSTSGKLDMLPAGDGNQELRAAPDLFQQLIEFARSVYPAVCIDLSGNGEKYAIETLALSSQIVLVSAIDVPSLNLAGRKLKQLDKMDLRDRVQIVLNEVSNPYRMTVAEAETFLGRRVAACLPSDARVIHDAIRDGKFVPNDCALGVKYQQLADVLLSRPGRDQEPAAVRTWFKRTTPQATLPVVAQAKA